MIGTGASLNVAVAGSLVLYRMAGGADMLGTVQPVTVSVRSPVDDPRVQRGSGYEQAEAELCLVEAGEFAVTLGPPA